ncbi:MAG: hypothetical protein JXA95_19280 [Spirochaetales bacterium]|nr:hypothetical protein [Spirochaetales bacterium]
MDENKDMNREKAGQFITRLMSNPALQPLAPLKKEQQIRFFLRTNEAQLFPTLSSPAFFPGKNQQEINRILTESLRETTNQKIFPLFKDFITDTLKSGALICAVGGNNSLNTNAVREGLLKLFTAILESNDARDALIPVATLFESPLLMRYIPQIVHRQKYISFEIRMVQRFKEVPENIIDYIKLTALITPVVYTYLENSSELVNGSISANFANQIIEKLSNKYRAIPKEIIAGLIQGSVAFSDDKEIPATSRLATLFARRAQTWNPDQKIDRGAESSDKSWFSVARKNYRYYGYDMDMIMELYNISAEMGW